MAASYVQPVQGQQVQLDQGIDYQGKPGDTVVSVGLARVDAVKADPNGFGEAVYYTLLDGPLRGQQIYVGHAQPDVRPGQHLSPGDPVATLLQHPLGNATRPGWTEIGFAKNGVPEPGSAQRFQKFVQGLGAATTPTAPSVPAQAGPRAAPALPAVGPVVDFTLPDELGTQPYQGDPGSGASGLVAQLWSRVQATDPATQLLQSNAQLLGG